jgi:Dehydrogenase E1 component
MDQTSTEATESLELRFHWALDWLSHKVTWELVAFALLSMVMEPPTKDKSSKSSTCPNYGRLPSSMFARTTDTEWERQLSEPLLTLNAVEHASSGKGPILMEMATYRYSGHSMSDPGTSYRSRDEIQEVRQKRDPITSFKEKMLSNGLATDAEIKAIDAEVKKEVDDATKKAKSDPGIKVEELTYDIYAKDDNLKQVRNVIPNTELTHKRFNKAKNL